MQEIKPEHQYKAEELQNIYSQMRPGALLVPMSQENGHAPEVGPRFMVYRLYLELGLDPAGPEVAYWNALKEADITVLDSLFNEFGVNPNSLGQAIYRADGHEGARRKTSPAPKQNMMSLRIVCAKYFRSRQPIDRTR